MCLLPWKWSSTTTVHCQANTSYAAWGACGHLQLQYVVKQINLMQRGVHVDTYNYSTFSSKYTLCSAGCTWTPTTTVRCQANTPYAAQGACEHLQLQYVVKQIHLMQRGCMWTPTTTVRCQANTPYAALGHVDTYNYSTLSSIYTSCSAGACGHLQLQYVVKQIHLMLHRVHVATYNYSTLSSKYTSCNAGTSGHLQLQYVVKQIHLMQRGVQHLDKLYIYIRNLLLTNTSACACPFNMSTPQS